MQFPKLDPFYIFIDFYLVQLIDYAIQRKLQAGGGGGGGGYPPPPPPKKKKIAWRQVSIDSD